MRQRVHRVSEPTPGGAGVYLTLTLRDKGPRWADCIRAMTTHSSTYTIHHSPRRSSFNTARPEGCTTCLHPPLRTAHAHEHEAGCAMNSFCPRHGWSHPTTQPTVPRPRRPPRSNRTMSVQGTKRSVSMPQWTLRLPREPTNATHGSRTPHTLPLPEGESTQPLSRRNARQGVNASVLQSMTRTGFMGCSTATSPRMSSAPSSAALC